MTAALYTFFFFLSYSVTLPNFTLLYLPIILLGVFPFWFGWSGLAGCMIGAFIGGAFVERLGFLGVFEVVCAIIIYLLNWILISQKSVAPQSKKSFASLMGVYAVSLFLGCGYIFWQYTVMPQLFALSDVLPIFVATYALNLPIVLITCPLLMKTISPKISSWGFSVGTFWAWRQRRSNSV